MPNEIKLFGVIGEDVKASDVKNELDAMDQTQPLVVRIHSEGGVVTEGLALHDAFRAYPGQKKCVIESAAFSIASYIAMAFDDVQITENGYLMIHNPHVDLTGDDEAHMQAAGMLSKLKESMIGAYASKTMKSYQEIAAVMKAETWINARTALEQGYVNSIAPSKSMPQLAVAKMKNMPQGVFDSLCGGRSEVGDNREPTKEKPVSESQTPVAASISEIEAAFPRAKAEFVLKCIKRQLPMASVLTEALAAMDEENQSLKSQLPKAIETPEEPTEEPSAAVELEIGTEDEVPEEETMAKAKARSGVRPVAKSTVATPTASARWNQAIDSCLPKCNGNKARAVAMANKSNPGLRQAFLEEVNS